MKVKLTSMLRCTVDPERACVVDTDCNPDGSDFCIEHDDVPTEWWVQAPQQNPLGCLPDNECGDDDWFARVDEVFHSQTWNLTTLHIGDCEIIPGAKYEVYACLADLSDCSHAHPVATVATPAYSPETSGGYGDVVGPVVGTEFTPPDGYANVTDIFAYVMTKQNKGTTNTPQAHTTWLDLHGLGDGAAPQFILSISDLQYIQMGYQGARWTDNPDNRNPGCCGANPPTGCPASRPPPSNDPIEFTLVARDTIIGLGVDVYIDVFMDASSPVDIAGYDVRLKVTGGTAGALELEVANVEGLCNGGTDDGLPCLEDDDCANSGTCALQGLCFGGADDGLPCVQDPDCADPGACELLSLCSGGADDGLPCLEDDDCDPGTCAPSPPSDFVFGQYTSTKAASRTAMQLSNLKQTDGIIVQGLKYLATYRFQPIEGATGVFTFEVEDNYDLSFFIDRDGALLASQGGQTEMIGYGVDCFDDSHCAQIACQTGTCINYDCVYANAAQGTSCDDGWFCTGTDECDGNGACVSTGDPCGNPMRPQCCEATDRCICAACQCNIE